MAISTQAAGKAFSDIDSICILFIFVNFAYFVGECPVPCLRGFSSQAGTFEFFLWAPPTPFPGWPLFSSSTPLGANPCDPQKGCLELQAVLLASLPLQTATPQDSRVAEAKSLQPGTRCQGKQKPTEKAARPEVSLMAAADRELGE